MCTRCGRPQPARKGPCAACGEALPDAPVPGDSASRPFLVIEGSGGRAALGMDRKLVYRAGQAAAPVVVELDTLQSVTLVRRRFLEVLALVPAAVVLTLVLPSARPVAAVISGLGLLGALLWRRYFLVLKPRQGPLLRWPLGLARLGSMQVKGLEGAWATACPSLVSRGVSAQAAPSATAPSA
jgi:hypothetical protein